MLSRLGPFDEADRVDEVQLEVPPFRRRKALETEEIQVRDVRVSRVTVADGEGRARHGDFDAERAAGAADEGRLAAAELAREFLDPETVEPLYLRLPDAEQAR